MTIELGFTGKVHDLPIDEYHALPHLSNSGISDLLEKSPAHYKGKVWKDSKSKRIGTMIHTLCLEPHIARKWEARADLRLKGQRDEREIAEKAAAAVFANEDVQRAGVLQGEREVSFFWTIETPEGPCYAKCRFDSIASNLGWDLKSCEDASPRGFGHSISTWGYHTQNAWYMRGAHANGAALAGFAFIAVEKSAPWGVKVHHLDEAALAQAEHEIMEAATLWAKCHREQSWPGYASGSNQVALERWRITHSDND